MRLNIIMFFPRWLDGWAEYQWRSRDRTLHMVFVVVGSPTVFTCVGSMKRVSRVDVLELDASWMDGQPAVLRPAGQEVNSPQKQ